MAKLTEITAEQYDCLRELGVPVWWEQGGLRGRRREIIARMQDNDGCRFTSTMARAHCASSISGHAPIFYTLVDK